MFDRVKSSRAQSYSAKKLFLEISQNSGKILYRVSFLIKLKASGLQLY